MFPCVDPHKIINQQPIATYILVAYYVAGTVMTTAGKTKLPARMEWVVWLRREGEASTQITYVGGQRFIKVIEKNTASGRVLGLLKQSIPSWSFHKWAGVTRD